MHIDDTNPILHGTHSACRLVDDVELLRHHIVCVGSLLQELNEPQATAKYEDLPSQVSIKHHG